MTDASQGGAMRELEQARLDATARAAREATGTPLEQPVSRREPNSSPPSLVPAPTARQVIREVLFSGTVVETNVSPPPPSPPRDHEYSPRTRRANPADYKRIGRFV